MLYYASRTDKDDNRLMTSYGNAASQKKYGGPTARLHNGIVVCDRETGEFHELDNPDAYDFEKELLVRSRIHNANPEGTNGKYVIYKLKDGNWVKTNFRAASYGAANTILKSLVTLYGDLMVVEETEVVSGSSSNNAPF